MYPIAEIMMNRYDYDLKSSSINIRVPEQHREIKIAHDSTSMCFWNRIVPGYFDCSRTQIMSLDGSPRIVHGSFGCAYTKIKSLKGCPREVGKNFYFNNTPIRSMHNIHKYIDRIGGYLFICTSVRSHLLGVMKIRELRGLGTTYVQDVKLLQVITIINKYLDRRPDPKDRDIHLCQEELIEAGLERYAGL